MTDTALVDESWKDYDKLNRKYHDRVLTQNKFIMWLGEAKKNYVIQWYYSPSYIIFIHQLYIEQVLSMCHVPC